MCYIKTLIACAILNLAVGRRNGDDTVGHFNAPLEHLDRLSLPHSIAREHILQSENTFHSKRTHPIAREHILQSENTFHCKSTHSIVREHILPSENTFYSNRTHSIAYLPVVSQKHNVLAIVREHIL